MSKKSVLGSIFLTIAAFILYLVLNPSNGMKSLTRLIEKLTGEHRLIAVKDDKGDILYWTCTMHPSVKMQEPGTCPICAMNLVPVQKSPAQTSTNTTDDVDRSTFTVDPRQQQLINVQTTPVEFRNLEKEIRTIANLELDETRIGEVRTKINGWIDEVFANYTWQHIKKGDPLFSIYSPDLVATQEEYLLALNTAQELSKSSFENVSKGAKSLLQATRRRLQLFDITEEQIRHLEKTGEVQKNLIIYSPVTGHVTQRNAYPNMFVTPKTHLYTIVDHSNIWALVEVYEDDIAHIRKGQAVTMTTKAYPGTVFHGEVDYLYPHMDKTTRTMQARLIFPNPELKLLPEMYADVEIKVPLGRHLTVPESAVLRTGKRDLVFVDQGEGHMQLRRIEVGVKAGPFYSVLRGLRAGERVVSAANFLIDAESRVQGVEAIWKTPTPANAGRRGQNP